MLYVGTVIDLIILYKKYDFRTEHLQQENILSHIFVWEKEHKHVEKNNLFNSFVYIAIANSDTSHENFISTFPLVL